MGMDNQNVLYPSLFEDDYIMRSMGTIVTQPDVALTELVANAWDAGASHVKYLFLIKLMKYYG